MIKELNRNNKTDWNEEIQIELTLADLQIIYDCVGAMPIQYLKLKHENTNFNNLSKDAELLTDIYESLHIILSEHNGINDDNPTVNNNIDIEIDLTKNEEM